MKIITPKNIIEILINQWDNHPCLPKYKQKLLDAIKKLGNNPNINTVYKILNDYNDHLTLPNCSYCGISNNYRMIEMIGENGNYYLCKKCINKLDNLIEEFKGN